jgi:hypothetical protein
VVPYGIEPSKSNAALCREKGIEVFNGLYEDYPQGETFDLVSSYFVLEHVLSPVHFLSFCNRLCALSGIVCIEIPDIGSYVNDNSLSNLLYFYEHQSHFTKETIPILLERCGFELIEFYPICSRQFGVHFAGRKISSPCSQDDLHIPQNIFANVMEQVQVAEEVFNGRVLPFRNHLDTLLRERGCKNKKIVIFGAGNHTEVLLDLPEIHRLDIQYIVDNDKDKQGETLRGIPIRSPRNIDGRVEYIIVSSQSFEKEISKQLAEMGVGQQRIIRLYSNK